MTDMLPPDDNSDEALRTTLLAHFPKGLARVLFIEKHGSFAVALVEAGDQVATHRLQSICERSDDGLWSERITGNGPGWTELHDDGNVLTWWGDAPRRAGWVQIEYGDGFEAVVRVQSGVFFHCRWDVNELHALRALPAIVTAVSQRRLGHRRN
jgi:hypothetical protein